MSLLKVSVLSLSGLTLWLAPPFIFSRKIPLHNFMQGIALVSGFACCFEARKGALKLAKAEEFEALKQAAVDADVVHEISTSVYVSEEFRMREAESLLNESSERSKTIELLERALSLDAEEPEPEPERSPENSLSTPEPERVFSDLTPEEQVLVERIMILKTRGYGKAKIILEIWGASKGGSQKYKDAEAEYKRLVGE